MEGLRKGAARLWMSGIIAGASDNDPTTVATLAVVGSTTVYGLGWLVVLVVPMLMIVQAIGAAIGGVSHAGLEDCVRRRFGKGWALVVLVTVLAVNVATLAADLEGGGAAIGLLTGTDYRWWIFPLAVGLAALLIVARYERFAAFARVLPLVFFTYAGAAVLAHPDWPSVLKDTFIPHLHFDKAYTSAAIALLGTTLTAYAYVWETIEVAHDRPALDRIGLVQVSAAAGMVIAGLSFWFIAVATGATLGVHHHTVETAADAAQALAPVAGRYASVLFGIGLLGSALLAVPVLAGTSAYVMAETFGWKEGLDLSFVRAPAFYRALVAAFAVAVVIAYAGVQPIRLLLWSSIAGGIATPVTLTVMMLVAGDRDVMGSRAVRGPLAIAGWCVTGVVTAALVAYFASLRTGGG